jgi:hypothetical protein
MVMAGDRGMITAAHIDALGALDDPIGRVTALRGPGDQKACRQRRPGPAPARACWPPPKRLLAPSSPASKTVKAEADGTDLLQISYL